MSEFNPYQPPTTTLIPYTADLQLRVEPKGVLFIPIGADLPPRCIKCNAPARLPIKTKKYSWYNPWFAILIFVNILIFAIVAAIFSKKYALSIGVCQHHHLKRLKILGASVLVTGLVSLLAMYYIRASGGLISFSLFLLLVIGLVIVARFTNLITIKRIDASGVRIKGCGEPFLHSIEKKI